MKIKVSTEATPEGPIIGEDDDGIFNEYFWDINVQIGTKTFEVTLYSTRRIDRHGSNECTECQNNARPIIETTIGGLSNYQKRKLQLSLEPFINHLCFYTDISEFDDGDNGDMPLCVIQAESIVRALRDK